MINISFQLLKYQYFQCLPLGLFFIWLEESELSSRCSNREIGLISGRGDWSTATWPVRNCNHRNALVFIESSNVYPHIRLDLFLFEAVTSVKKCLSSLFPLDKIEDRSTQQTLDHMLWAGPLLDAQRQVTLGLYPWERWLFKVQFQIC